MWRNSPKVEDTIWDVYYRGMNHLGYGHALFDPGTNFYRDGRIDHGPALGDIGRLKEGQYIRELNTIRPNDRAYLTCPTSFPSGWPILDPTRLKEEIIPNFLEPGTYTSDNITVTSKILKDTEMPTTTEEFPPKYFLIVLCLCLHC